MKDYIAVIDSGVGGLDILNVLKENLKNESFIFIGDNLHVPYGQKTKEQLEEYGIEIAKYLEKNQVKMIIIACNTLSLNAIDKMREKVNVPIYGIVRPTVKGFLNYGLKSVLVLATEATINSHRYVDFLNELDPTVKIFQQAAPKLVEYIEGNHLELVDDAIKEYIEPYHTKVDAIILGCTHFPIISGNIEKLYPDLAIIDSRNQMVQLVNDKLDYHNIRALEGSKQDLIIHATGSIDGLIKASQHFFDYEGVKTKQRGVKYE